MPEKSRIQKILAAREPEDRFHSAFGQRMGLKAQQLHMEGALSIKADPNLGIGFILPWLQRETGEFGHREFLKIRHARKTSHF